MSVEGGLYMRWMVRADVPRVMQIEKGSPMPWSDQRLLTTLRDQQCIGMVCELLECPDIVGHVVYKFRFQHLELLKIEVDPLLRRAGIGSVILRKIFSKMAPQTQRTWLSVDVPERCVDAQLFFCSHGLRATSIVRPGGNDGDAVYRMKREFYREGDGATHIGASARHSV